MYLWTLFLTSNDEGIPINKEKKPYAELFLISCIDLNKQENTIDETLHWHKKIVFLNIFEHNKDEIKL